MTDADADERMISFSLPESLVDDGIAMLKSWHDGVYEHLRMSEGFLLSDILREMGYDDLAYSIVRSVWYGEEVDERDDEPWVNGHGSRKSDDDVTYEDRFERERAEQFVFDPRRDWTYEGETDGTARTV